MKKMNDQPEDCYKRRTRGAQKKGHQPSAQKNHEKADKNGT